VTDKNSRSGQYAYTPGEEPPVTLDLEAQKHFSHFAVQMIFLPLLDLNLQSAIL
jgi:hypothetical protein